MSGRTHEMVIWNAPRGMASSPLWDICRKGNFPTDIPCHIRANWKFCKFASVSQIAAAAIVQSAANSSGMNCESIPSATADRYISRMDYYKMAGIKHDEDFLRHSEGDRFLPLTKIEVYKTNEIAERLKSMVISHLSFSDSAVDLMQNAFGEVLDNVLQHAKTSVPGLSCSQYYPKDNFVEVCIVDCGCGISASMANNPAYSDLDDEDLLKTAFDRYTGEFYGVPAYGTANVSGGMGLWIAANIVRALGGRIWAVSRENAIEISPEGSKSFGGMYFPGTIICMRFPVTNRVITGDEVFGNGNQSAMRWSPSESWWYEGSDDEVLW